MSERDILIELKHALDHRNVSRGARQHCGELCFEALKRMHVPVGEQFRFLLDHDFREQVFVDVLNKVTARLKGDMP